MLIGKTYFKQARLMFWGVDGSEVGLTLDDAPDVYNWVV